MSRGKLAETEKKKKVEDMRFDLPRPKPIRGYPELVWAGKRPFTSTRYYPAQERESCGKPVNGWMNQIYWGDNLQVLSHLLKEFRGKIDLVYIDPPFDSKADYKKKIKFRKKKEVKADSNIDVKNDHTAFEEKQYSDIWTNDEYIQFIYERLILIRELLSDNGVIYVHCDWHKSQYLRCILDEIFGKDKFINEIIWHYTGGGRSESYFSKKHDSIFIYAKKDKIVFNQDSIRIPYKETSAYAKGGIVSKNGKKYMPNPLGTIPDDVWDIPIINPLSQERLDYPTQKPESLLERIIKASTNPGSLILDCFMGSGTTQAVAMKLGRRFIGADINLGAIETTTKRLIKIIKEREDNKKTLFENGDPLYLNFQVYNVNNYDMFKNELEAKDLILEAMEIEPFDERTVFDGMKNGYKVKILSPNRIATPEDLNSIITGIDYKELDKKLSENPNEPQEKIMLVCMGHLPGLDIELKKRIGLKYTIDVQVVDILNDEKWKLTFKKEPEAAIVIKDNWLSIKKFFPCNLMKKLADAGVKCNDWRELVESVAIDYNYDGQVFRPQEVDIPGKNEQVEGKYKLPGKRGVVRVKITDLLSESLEKTVEG